MSPSPAKPLRLRVKPAAERQLRAGHPWLYESGVRNQNRPGTTGELGVVYDQRDTFLAIGLYDAESPIRLRVLHRGKPQAIDSAWWSERLEQALRKRTGLFDEETTGYRWIHGENDGWPGLVLDRYGEILVLKIYTGAWLPRLPEIQELIWTRLQPTGLVVRFSRNISAHSAGSIGPEPRVLGRVPCPVLFLETGIRLQADPVRGQKTGFFLDQRENRRAVAGLASGRRVLNAFSFSGAFSLYAARGGARGVVDLDISEYALQASRDQFALNRGEGRIPHCIHETIKADAFDWLEASARPEFDLIILDPPSLAKRESERAGALRAYGRLAVAALSWLRPAGVLVACSCSAHVSSDEFFSVVRGAARKSGRVWRELRVTGQPADHPAAFAEAQYLKGIYLEFRS